MPAESEPTVHGRTADGFDGVRAAFADVLAANRGGANLALYRDGNEVANLWGGTNIATGQEFTEGALVMTASCTKGITTICALMLVDSGRLDPDAPVAEYWPEFAANGKADVPVRWLLTHQVGLPVLDPSAGLGTADLLDWDRITDSLARQTPMWEPGRYCGYHAVTFGYLVGEVVRRITGTTVGQFLAENVTGRLGADFWIGLPAELEERVRPSTPAPDAKIDPPDLGAIFAAHDVNPTSPLARAMLAPGEDGPDGAVWNSRPYRAAEVPAANGIGSGLGLARIYAACIGDVDGVRLLSPELVERARTPMTDDVPTPPEFAAITTMPPRFGLGFQLPRSQIDAMLGTGSFGHTGAGGRLGFADPELGVAFGFTCDAMIWDGLTKPDPRWTPLLAAVSSALSG